MKKNTDGFPLSKIVEVQWRDANATGGWGSKRQYQSHDVALCQTVGYLFKQDKNVLMVCTTQGNDGDSFNQAIAIPRPWIVKVAVLKK